MMYTLSVIFLAALSFSGFAAAALANEPKARKALLQWIGSVTQKFNAATEQPSQQVTSTANQKESSNKQSAVSAPKSSPSAKDAGESRELQQYKDLYYKLHNLEHFPDVLPRARDQLISLFAETLSKASNERLDESILKVDTFSRDAVNQFMKDLDDRVNKQYEEYIARRKAGGPMELFKDKAEAAWYLKQIAPVKYVDGAWLGWINNITLPFRFRNIVKHEWQVLSEELGDGDLSKNHTYCFKELTKSTRADLPPGDSRDFIHPRHGLNQTPVWKSALAQLLISLFPNEFFPEILGFNMHFEAIAMETLKAAKEVNDVGFDPYYFVLHISIDNADSGHTAVAQNAVCDYIEQVEREDGPEAAHQAWRRVQTGFNLSDSLPGKATPPSKQKNPLDDFPRNELESELIKIIKSKCDVGQKVHCQSAIRVGGKRLVEWMDPEVMENRQKQMEFIDAFSNTKSCITRGDAMKSMFYKELLWEGRMFGAFTQSETDLVKTWIDRLPHSRPETYWRYTGRDEQDLTSLTDARIDLSYERYNGQTIKEYEDESSGSLPENLYEHNFGTSKIPDASLFLPLWFSHPTLLEGLVSVPWKTINPQVCEVVKVLRAQSGFDIEYDGVAGTDESNRSNESIGLVEIGQEMLEYWKMPLADNLKKLLEEWTGSEFSIAMLQLSLKPEQNRGLLLGMAVAFSALHRWMADSPMLSETTQKDLAGIAEREVDGLDTALQHLDQSQKADANKGYRLAIRKIEECFAQ